jgi:guanylate kinase
LCLVLAAPSGAGKSSIAARLLAEHADLTLSVSVTTRAPRPGEQEGVHYLFRTDAEFAAMVSAGELLEWARVFDRGYGTPRAPVEAALTAGRDVVFDIDWQGYRQLRAALPGDVVGVFILPPTLQALEARLRTRGDNADEIARRMAVAREEISHWAEFDHVLVNHSLNRSVEDVHSILRAARTVTQRQPGLAAFVAELVAG